MASKKKGKPKKKALNAAKPVLTIYIHADGTVCPQYSFLDGNGLKHPPQVYWLAIDPSKTYQIDFAQPPCPFKKVPKTLRTDASGTTDTLTVDKNCGDVLYSYRVTPVSLAFKTKGLSAQISLTTSGGGIIIDG